MLLEDWFETWLDELARFETFGVRLAIVGGFTANLVGTVGAHLRPLHLNVIPTRVFTEASSLTGQNCRPFALRMPPFRIHQTCGGNQVGKSHCRVV